MSGGVLINQVSVDELITSIKDAVKMPVEVDAHITFLGFKELRQLEAAMFLGYKNVKSVIDLEDKGYKDKLGNIHYLLRVNDEGKSPRYAIKDLLFFRELRKGKR